MFKTVYLSLGSNLGNREQNFNFTIGALEREGISVVRQSSLYETEPQDVQNQPLFLNMVLECTTRFFPLQLLGVLQKLEREAGRVRTQTVRRGPRIIDLDILLYADAQIETPELSVPHPRMLQRRFVLEPLLEIAPGIRMPGRDVPLNRYLLQVRDQKLRKWERQNG